MIEHIHPFRDGNGRIGRLWQTLILSKWRPVFAWMPTETLIRRHQQEYYSALQASREPEIDAASFVDYMLEVIQDSIVEYEALATADAPDGGVNGGVNDQILALLRAEPSMNAESIAERLGIGKRTAERRLSELKTAGRLRREGSPKTGKWVVVR